MRPGVLTRGRTFHTQRWTGSKKLPGAKELPGASSGSRKTRPRMWTEKMDFFSKYEIFSAVGH